MAFSTKQERAAVLIEHLANMTLDGEEIDGSSFVMENDDAVSTLSALIEEAREFCKMESAPSWTARGTVRDRCSVQLEQLGAPRRSAGSSPPARSSKVG